APSFASDRRTSTFSGSTTPIPGFGGGATGIIPSFGSPKTPKPGTNPVSIDPDLLGSIGRNPKNPFLPHTGNVTTDLSSILKGGDHMGEATSSLISGNYYSADRECLKNAQGTPAGIGFDNASIDAYRDPGYAAQYETKKALEKIPANIMQRFKPRARTILTVGNPCNDTTKKQMCRALLGKAITDPRQANYKPSAMSEARPDLTPDTQQAKANATLELDKAVEAKDNSEAITPTPADKTVLLIVMIDKALAAGDKVGAQGAIELLRDLNPSAAHALDCLGVMTFNTEEPEEKSPLDKKEKIGPITGFDYSTDIEHQSPGAIIAGVAAVGEFLGLEAAKAVIVKVVDDSWKAVTGNKIFETEENRKALMKQEYKEFIACKGAGGHGCDQAWPEGAKMDQRGAEGKSIFTGEPLNKDNQGTGGPEHPVMDLSPLPEPGSMRPGGASIGPAPERPVMGDFEMEDSPFITKLKSKNEREELLKTRDPHAAENYCQGVVNNFKAVKKKGLTMTFFEGAKEGFAASTGKQAGMGGGVMAFDSWNEEFWGSMKDYTSKLPGALSKQNACNTADPVQPQ
ncbi:MAG: hypothetical protein H7318_12015, partial [Oligoflexus sp.]|nr:hypothetical protein [Oligoflexus sp.]